jgi:SAM-dependent methyltransferase
MRLVEIELALDRDTVPTTVAALLAEAKTQIDLLEEESRASIPAFVPSDFELVYRGLAAIKSGNLATGRRFLEWGSGNGVVTCLAVLLGFDAAGIEIEPKLVRLAEQLAKKHRVAAEFACGSFVPTGSEPRLDLAGGDVTWLASGGHDGYEQLQLDPDDFDIIFAYPWPGEEQVIFDLFADNAAVGALLLTYHGQEGLRLQRKTRR